MIRKFNFYDIPVLERMLADEGLSESEMEIKSGITYVLEEDKTIKGFFTFRGRLSHGFLTLIHFCTKRGNRSPKLARDLVKALTEKVKELKTSKFIIDVKKDFPNVQRVIEYYFKVKPYAQTDNATYYLASIKE